jgi:hypothetical protein
VKKKSAAVGGTAAPGDSVEMVVLSHIAKVGTPRISWLTNKAGKQEANNDEERECAEHSERLPIG